MRNPNPLCLPVDSSFSLLRGPKVGSFLFMAMLNPSRSEFGTQVNRLISLEAARLQNAALFFSQVSKTKDLRWLLQCSCINNRMDIYKKII